MGWSGTSILALTALHSLPPRVFVVVIFPQRKGRIRSAERTEVHLVVTIHFTNLLSALRCGPWAYERKFVMPVRRLPSNPDLDHLKYQAKDLLKEHAARDRGAAQRLREFHPRFHRATDAEIFAAQLKVSDAQLTIARESGFPSWARLKRHIETPTLTDQLNLPHHERIEDPIFRRAVDLIDAGDVAGLRGYLEAASEACAISTSHSKVGTTFITPRCWSSSLRIRFATASSPRTLSR